MRRTAVINQIRGLLLERGITVRQGRRHVNAALPGILEDASVKVSGTLRMLLAQLKLELDDLQMRIDEVDAMINKAADNGERRANLFSTLLPIALIDPDVRAMELRRQPVSERSSSIKGEQVSGSSTQ